ncbi:MAG: hypothetical protein COB67_12410 [SAR324 cluster bacterium]|uniref:Uncharacterized protein n=1 Tax=SAR324 cluster bacterium TaxID=2024889 RepID=A0A2A4SRW5_9DELT|nr:MAG: hypothetical protein COB67_12410 [SAR324 cluster bacterium]
MDDELIFAEEKEESENELAEQLDPWKILIVDDEKQIHKMTIGVLDDVSFEDRKLLFLNAYSGAEAKTLMQEHDDIALILLDVVMETDNAGLEVAQYIRQELKNNFVRIVLRTGQPGLSPEKEVIIAYDINDYKSKTELTVQKLYTTVVSSLRSYRDLRMIESHMKVIEKSRKGLEKIIESSASLFELQSFKAFTSGVLIQLLSLLRLNDSSFYCQSTGFTASFQGQDFVVQAATGKFEQWIDQPLDKVLNGKIREYLAQAADTEKSYFTDDVYIEYFSTKGGMKHMLYVEGCGELSELDKDLIKIFSRNVTIAFENINLKREIEESQEDMFQLLGEALETRSKKAANHVRRLTELSYLLATHAGLSEEDAQLLRVAAPMHDIGKIGVPDAVLLKPGKLTEEEFEVVKTHTDVGYQILKDSRHLVLQAASTIAHQHQEKWDGSGYPQGLKGEEIHLFGRIIGLVDVFDTLTHSRCYKEAWTTEKALNLIREERGCHFDPQLVDIFLEHQDAFIKICEKYPDKPKLT